MGSTKQSSDPVFNQVRDQNVHKPELGDPLPPLSAPRMETRPLRACRSSPRHIGLDPSGPFPYTSPSCPDAPFV